MQSESRTTTNWTLRLSGVFGALFVGNVILGKASVVMGWGAVGMNDVAEFLTLFLAAIFFVAAALKKEREQEAALSDQS